MNLPLDFYSRVRFKWDGGSAIHVVSDKSLLSNFDPDAKCISEPAFLGDVYLQGAGEMKIRLKDGTVVLLKEVFYSDQLRENILSSVAYNSFFTGVVGNKLIRLDTGAEIGYLHNGTPQVDVEVLDFDYPIDETSLTKQPKLPAMMLGRLNEPTQSLSAEEVNDEDEESEDDREFLEGNDEFAVIAKRLTNEGNSLLRKPSDKSLEWHAKLGHPGKKLFEHFKSGLELTGVHHVPMSQCDTCLFSKAKRVTPKVLQDLDPVSRPFEILHTDLSGPFTRPIGWDNSLYFLTVVDRFSRVLHVSPIRYKNAGTTELLKSVKGAYLGPGVQREGHRIVSFDPPLVFESAQVRFVEDRFYFKEFDYDVLKLKHHNRVPLGLLPGIKRPHGTKKVSDKQAVAELMQVKEFFGTLTETDRALMLRKRSGVALEESVSRTQKRSKVSPPQVDSQENSLTSREARNETIDNNRIGDKQGSVQAELPITAGVREVDASTTLLERIPSPTPSSVGEILSSQNTDERVTLAQTDNRAEEDALFDKGKDAESPLGSPVPLPAVGESFQRTYPKKRMTRSERKAHLKRMTPPRKKLVLLSRGRNDTEVLFQRLVNW
ncbi:hypothetical protein HF325_005422 [Metschnikowia pulcherrima]|uniref:Retrovirus-related Pol polyprotein from transposon TNT 1-94-like beta-barrel domain-containing protein n=1 Tax=Metschnikowia pulcherrima TaxID=27326 RepID=A0A8H7LA59_9ASCO|nr:hypothetical protein HF325_005422 [Metschnikowia pulcherrima]